MATTQNTPAVILTMRAPRKRSTVGIRVLASLVDYGRVIVIGADATEYADMIAEQYGTDDSIVIHSDTSAASSAVNVKNAAKRTQRTFGHFGSIDANDTDGGKRFVALVIDA